MRLSEKLIFTSCAALALLVAPLAGLAAQSADALQAYRNGQYQVAIDTTLKELQADPSNMDSYAVLGWSLNSLKRYSEAIQYAQKGRQINASDHRLVEVLAEANFALKNDISALSYYQQYVSLAILHEVENRYIRDAYRTMAEIFIRFNEYHHADIALVAAVQYDKGKTANEPTRAARIWSRLGWVREQLNDATAAQAAYDKALAMDPSNSEALAGKERLKARVAG